MFCPPRDVPPDYLLVDEPIEFPASRPIRWSDHLFESTLLSDFDKACDVFKPDFVFFAGSAAKPARLARRARELGHKTVFLFYINDFFCDRIYAGLRDGPCTACAASGEHSAVLNGCVPVAKSANFVKSALVRRALQIEIFRAHKVLGYSADQCSLYETFGVAREAIAEIGFQFDPTDLKETLVGDEGYFAITGQPIVQKGFHLLASIISRLPPDVELRISLRDQRDADAVLTHYDLKPFVRTGQLVVVTGLNKRRDYVDFLARARGVILPTYYPTTGEFVLQEAMFLGKPVHAFNVGAHRNLLRDGDNALVSPVGDLDDYAQKIERINDDREFRTRVSNAARETSLGLYTGERQRALKLVFG